MAKDYEVDVLTLCKDLESYCEELNKIANELQTRGCIVKYSIRENQNIGQVPVDILMPIVTQVLVGKDNG